jgi:hypothetical protein
MTQSLKKIFLIFSFIVILLCQLSFWFYTKHVKPEMIIVPEVPSFTAVSILSLGDLQFYFRNLSFKIQNAGDSWGRFTALKEYNYAKLQEWFYLLDKLDSKSNFVPSLASYYYSQSQNVKDNIFIVKYLEDHALKDLRNKWWWMTQAVYIANHKLEDQKLALRLSYYLTTIPKDVNVPFWVRQMPAFIHEDLGEIDAAKRIIVDILTNFNKFTPGELNFMEYFIKDRLNDEQFKFQIIEELRKNAKWENKHKR